MHSCLYVATAAVVVVVRRDEDCYICVRKHGLEKKILCDEAWMVLGMETVSEAWTVLGMETVS